MNGRDTRPRFMRRLFCLLAYAFSLPAFAEDGNLSARLILASEGDEVPTSRALQDVVAQLASKGVRSATLLDENMRVGHAKLAAEGYTLDAQIEAVSANRARLVVHVDGKEREREVALEIPKGREVLVGVGRIDDGLLVASLVVHSIPDSR